MKITYKSNTMRFVIEVLDRQLTLTIYEQPSSIKRGGCVTYQAGGIKFLSGSSVMISCMFPSSAVYGRDGPLVYILGNSGAKGHTHVCETTNEAFIGASRLYHGLVGLDNLTGEV